MMASLIRPSMQLPFLKESCAAINVSACGISLDLSRQRLTQEDLKGLIKHAGEAALLDAFREMCAGAVVNRSESRPALHTALRSFDSASPHFAEVDAERRRMLAFADRIFSEGRIDDVINIGIGGSEMGPHAVWHALQPLKPRIRLHFLSTVDGTLLDRILSRCNPHRTLAIVSSKSFGTRETMVNAEMVDEWFAEAGIVGEARNDHMVTVSAKTDAAESMGLRPENGFRIWPWVGGRFSVWSSIGLPLAIGLGKEKFLDFLRGANAMDKHAMTAPLENNLPALLALLAYWDAVRLEIPSRCLLPYDSRLDGMPAWLQQLEMESLGKNRLADGSGMALTRTGQGIWGSNGNKGQHSFYQWLREGAWCTSIDLVKVCNPGHGHAKMARVLNANAEAQAEALVTRQDDRCFNSVLTLSLADLKPETLGAFMAMYEHKVAMLGMLLKINPFDQPGVEFAKKIANLLENKTFVDVSITDSN